MAGLAANFGIAALRRVGVFVGASPCQIQESSFATVFFFLRDDTPHANQETRGD